MPIPLLRTGQHSSGPTRKLSGAWLTTCPSSLVPFLCLRNRRVPLLRLGCSGLVVIVLCRSARIRLSPRIVLVGIGIFVKPGGTFVARFVLCVASSVTPALGLLLMFPPVCLANLRLRGGRLAEEEVLELDQAEFNRARACRSQAQQVAAFRPRLPELPVLRADGAWLPGDKSHPLGRNRRFLLHESTA